MQSALNIQIQTSHWPITVGKPYNNKFDSNLYMMPSFSNKTHFSDITRQIYNQFFFQQTHCQTNKETKFFLQSATGKRYDFMAATALKHQV
jgi:hypothetical protein